MPETEIRPTKSDFAQACNDTSYFINAIVSDYDFYSSFIDAVKNGGPEFELKRRKIKKDIDEKMLAAVEDGMSYLDNALRNPTRYIEERDEVLPIELSHNITSRSLRHLAQHTDYINSIDDEGNIVPNKILNVFHEETLITYENKFLNTLIQRLYVFISRRYTQLKEGGDSEDSVAMEFSSEFSFGTSRGKMNFSIEIADKNDIGPGGTSKTDRLARLNSAIIRYLNSDFTKAMGKNYIRPPIMRTNAITKNKDLYQCLLLWEFIESYEKVGYDISVQESAEKPNEQTIHDLYATLALQYMIFRYRVKEADSEDDNIIDINRTEEPISPVFKSDLQDINTDSFNVYNTEYRQVLSVAVSGNRRLTEGELRIRSAIDTALAADRLRTARKRELERHHQKNVEKKLAKKKSRSKPKGEPS